MHLVFYVLVFGVGVVFTTEVVASEITPFRCHQLTLPPAHNDSSCDFSPNWQRCHFFFSSIHSHLRLRLSLFWRLCNNIFLRWQVFIHWSPSTDHRFKCNTDFMNSFIMLRILHCTATLLGVMFLTRNCVYAVNLSIHLKCRDDNFDTLLHDIHFSEDCFLKNV